MYTFDKILEPTKINGIRHDMTKVNFQLMKKATPIPRTPPNKASTTIANSKPMPLLILSILLNENE
jgi:hypothetical protein